MQELLFAYLDPGTGSMIWQVIIASFMGIIIVFGIMKNRIRALFSKKSSASDDLDEQETTPAKTEASDEHK